MPLKAIDSYLAGGVDSRSNPINMPPDAYLLLENFWPQQDGGLRLRDGYVLFANGVPQVSIYSIQPFTGPGPAYKPLVMFWQNQGAPLSISTIVYAGGFAPTAIVTVSSTAYITSGDTVSIAGNSVGLFNQEWQVTVLDNTHFSIPFALAGALSGIGGTATDITNLINGIPTPYIVDPATQLVTSPAVLGTPMQSSARFCYFYTDGHLHAFNGTDAKWFDGYVWRDIGLPQPNLVAAGNLAIVQSVNEFTATQQGAVTLTLAGGGSFPADTVGRYFYAAFFDLALQEIGPATIASGPNNGFVKFGANQELQVAVLPNTAATHSTWVKLLGLTDDGGDQAHFAVVSTFAITAGTIGTIVVSLAESTATTKPTLFGSPSFAIALSAANLTGGPATATVSGAEQTINGGVQTSTVATITGFERTALVGIPPRQMTVYDYGYLTVVITGNNGYKQTFYGYYSGSAGSSSTPTKIATALAAAINSGSGGVLSAVASGGAVTIVPGNSSSTVIFSITVSSTTSDPMDFPNPPHTSFPISVNNAQFGDLTIYDTGTATVTVAGVNATATYGAGDTPSTVAAKLAIAINSLPSPEATASVAGAVVTITQATVGVEVVLTATANGFSANDVVGILNSGDAAYDGKLFTVISATTDTFTIFVPNAINPIQNGTVQKLLSVADNATTATILAPTFFTPYEVNQPLGLAASSVGGPQPGYQFYISLYMLNAGGHVGNRVAIGPRIVPTVRTNIRILGAVPVAYAEQFLLLGRTGDGAEVPYAMIDDNGNWITSIGGFGNWLVTSAAIDGNAEMPYRNYPPPATLDYNQQLANLAGGAAQNPPVPNTFSIAWVESDHCCGAIVGSPTIYRSGSALDLAAGQFVGLPEQSYDPADIETFPTGEPITCGQGYQQESWIYTAEDCGVLVELAGELSWQGPWNIGACGQYAWARGWKNLPFWVTQEKQLATVSLGGTTQVGGTYTTDQAGPVPISDEYEAALLSQIGDQYLSQVEISYIRIPQKRVEVLRIGCLDSNGNPFTIIHDFNLRGGDSPYGKAYQETMLGPLASVYTQQYVKDGNTKGQIFCGGSDGNLYELYSGGNDAGTEFLAQALKLIYLGPDRLGTNWLEWWGDETLQLFIAKQLDTPFGTGQMTPLCDDAPTAVQGEEDDNHWQVPVPEPEMVHCYLMLQLESHSADGTTALNTPPHMPLETYGRVWLASPLIGDRREK